MEQTIGELQDRLHHARGVVARYRKTAKNNRARMILDNGWWDTQADVWQAMVDELQAAIDAAGGAK